MKLKALVVTAAVAAISMSSSVWASVQTIKVGHGAAETYHMHQAWVKFKEVVEKESNNKLQVEIFPNGQVGGDRELIEAVEVGIVDMTAPVVEVMAGWDPAFTIPGLPYTFTDRADALNALDGDFGQALLDKAGDFGLQGLGWMENGTRQITSNTRPVESPSDLRGVKLRTMQVEAHMDAFRAMGANPTPMSFNEVYSALQQGVVDAQENPLGHIYSSRFYEVQKYLTVSNHVYSTHMVLANPDFYYSLADSDQEIISKALAEAVDYQQALIAEEESQQLQAIEESGVQITHLSQEQLQSFMDVTAPVREAYFQTVDASLLEKLEQR